MDNSEKQFIHELFQKRNYIQLYHTQKETIQKMLLFDNQKDFEDFLEYNCDIEEEVFWLYYSAVKGESILIEGYDGDVSKKVAAFLKQKLPKELFCTISHAIQNIYVDLGTKNNIEKQIAVCNELLQNTVYSLLLCYDENYCAGAYFLKVEEKEQ